MALNFSLDSLLEQSLLTEGPWWVYILNGAWWTIGLTIAAFALALLIGIIVGTLRTAPNKFVRGLCEAWNELVVPELVPWYKDWLIEVDPAVGQFVTAFICMGLFTSSRIAEQVRAGISSLPRGLPNAAKALGFTTVQAYVQVVLPMAMRLIVPPLTSESMNLVKNTAVAMTIGLPELTMRANEMGENTFTFFAAYLWATILYIIIALVVNQLMAWVEKKSVIPGFIAAK